MSREIRWLPRAQRDLKKLDPPVRRRVIDAVKHFAQTGEGDVVRLVDTEPPEHHLIHILRVMPRGKAYR